MAVRSSELTSVQREEQNEQYLNESNDFFFADSETECLKNVADSRSYLDGYVFISIHVYYYIRLQIFVTREFIFELNHDK